MKKYFVFTFTIIILHVFTLTKLKFTAWPEMILWPYLIVNGFIPYKEIAIVHTPFLISDLALFFQFFGVGINQLQIFTWTLIGLTDLIVFGVALRLYGKKVALTGLIAYVLWQVILDGNGLWFDLMLAPMGILSFYFAKKKKFGLVGIITALMFFTKQTAFWYLIPIVFEVLSTNKSKKQIFLEFALGGTVIAALFLLSLWLWGALSGFWNWAVSFGVLTLPRLQGQIQAPSMMSLAMSTFPFSLLLIGLLSKKKDFVKLIPWIVAGSLGAYPRFELFHFQPALPFLAIGIGQILSKPIKGFWRKAYIGFYVAGLLYLLASFFIRNFNEGVRFYEGRVLEVTNYLKESLDPGDEILVLNWWDNVYALSDTMPATNPWVPQLSWYQEVSGIQDDEVADLEKIRPKIIILNPYTETGLSSYIPGKVYDYVKANYRSKEKIDGIEILTLKEYEDNNLKQIPK